MAPAAPPPALLEPGGQPEHPRRRSGRSARRRSARCRTPSRPPSTRRLTSSVTRRRAAARASRRRRPVISRASVTGCVVWSRGSRGWRPRPGAGLPPRRRRVDLRRVISRSASKANAPGRHLTSGADMMSRRPASPPGSRPSATTLRAQVAVGDDPDRRAVVVDDDHRAQPAPAIRRATPGTPRRRAARHRRRRDQLAHPMQGRATARPGARRSAPVGHEPAAGAASADDRRARSRPGADHVRRPRRGPAR